MKTMKCLSATGQLGFGIPQAAFENGIAKYPDFIGGDMGSLDPDPTISGAEALGGVGRQFEEIWR